jgi:hypothetical protein
MIRKIYQVDPMICPKCGGAEQSFPEDDFVQADLSTCTAQADAPEAF